MPLGVKDLVERVAELLVAIVDQESERVVVTELHDEAAHLLHDPGSGVSKLLIHARNESFPGRTEFWPRTPHLLYTFVPV
jgi:hypothetical protein